MPLLILVAEDDLAMPLSISDCLEYCGYSVIAAEDGQQALSMVEKYHPHLLISDIRMPKKNGYDGGGGAISTNSLVTFNVVNNTFKVMIVFVNYLNTECSDIRMPKKNVMNWSKVFVNYLNTDCYQSYC